MQNVQFICYLFSKKEKKKNQQQQQQQQQPQHQQKFFTVTSLSMLHAILFNFIVGSHECKLVS